MGLVVTRPPTQRDTRRAALKRGALLALGVILALICALLGAGAAWWAAGQRSAGFVATAVVVINPLPGNPFHDEEDSDLVVLQTDAQLAKSDAVYDLVAAAPDILAETDLLRRRTSVTVSPGSRVVRVSYVGGSAESTRVVAAELGESYLLERRARAVEVRDAQIARLRDALSRVEEDLSRAQAQADLQPLLRRRALLDEQLRLAREQALSPGEVLGVPTAVASRQKRQLAAAAVGGAVGLLAGGWVAYRLTRRSG